MYEKDLTLDDLQRNGRYTIKPNQTKSYILNIYV